MIRPIRAALATALLCTTLATAAATPDAPRTPAPRHALVPQADEKPGKAVIASAHRLATEAGHEVLAMGGNAFDAAVAVGAALAVVEPSSSGIGGGAFWLLHRASDGHEVMIDARETAPAAIKAEMYLDADGQLDRDKSVNGALAAGIPGEPAGFVHLAQRYGKLPLSKSLAPAIRLAREGFPFGPRLKQLIGNRVEVLNRWPSSASIFLVDGKMPADDAIIRQPDLAATLQALAREGRDGFYRGAVAEKLVKGVRDAGGVWTLEDLASYEIVEREPLRTGYRDFHIVTAPPPSGGGVGLVTMLNVLEAYDLAAADATQRVHLVVEAMRRAFRDRSFILGDPDFVQMPVALLTDKAYAAGLRASIRLDQATPSASLPGIEAPLVGTDTTHFSVIDRDGNLVAATLTVNLPFGSGLVPPGTGVLLNNEMDDFALKAGVPNAYGLIGGDANAVLPRKRMLSSMTPTFVFGKDRIGVLGTPGGSRIGTMVLLAVLEFVEGRTPAEFVAKRRFHHQYLPDAISAEKGAIAASDAERLRHMGHVVNEGEREWGNMNTVVWDRRSNTLSGSSDPRGLVGSAVVR